MNDPLIESIQDFKAPEEPVEDELTTSIQAFKKDNPASQVQKLAQYRPDALKKALEGYFLDDPYNDQRFIRDTRGKPWKLEDTPAWGIGKGALQGLRGFGKGAIHVSGKESLHEKPTHGGVWDNIRYYSGYFGPLNIGTSILETIGEVGQGFWMLAQGIGPGLAGGIAKALRIPYQEENIEKYDEIMDFITNKMRPYEKKRALASTMAILMSDDVDAINQILDVHFSDSKEREKAEWMQRFGQRTKDKEYTEADIAKALTELHDKYESIEMTPEDWATANAFWEGFTGHYSSADEFEKKMKQDPAEVALDLFDVYEVASGFKTAKRIATAGKFPEPPPSISRTARKPVGNFDFSDTLNIDRAAASRRATPRQLQDVAQRPKRLEFTGQDLTRETPFSPEEFTIRNPESASGWRPEFAPQVAGGVQARRISEDLQRQADEYFTEDAPASDISDTDLANAADNVEIMSNVELIAYRDELQRRVQAVADRGMRSTPPRNIGQMQAALDTFNVRIQDIGFEERPYAREMRTLSENPDAQRVVRGVERGQSLDDFTGIQLRAVQQWREETGFGGGISDDELNAAFSWRERFELADNQTVREHLRTIDPQTGRPRETMVEDMGDSTREIYSDTGEPVDPTITFDFSNMTTQELQLMRRGAERRGFADQVTGIDAEIARRQGRGQVDEIALAFSDQHQNLTPTQRDNIYQHIIEILESDEFQIQGASTEDVVRQLNERYPDINTLLQDADRSRFFPEEPREPTGDELMGQGHTDQQRQQIGETSEPPPRRPMRGATQGLEDRPVNTDFFADLFPEDEARRAAEQDTIPETTGHVQRIENSDELEQNIRNGLDDFDNLSESEYREFTEAIEAYVRALIEGQTDVVWLNQPREWRQNILASLTSGELIGDMQTIGIFEAMKPILDQAFEDMADRSMTRAFQRGMGMLDETERGTQTARRIQRIRERLRDFTDEELIEAYLDDQQPYQFDPARGREVTGGERRAEAAQLTLEEIERRGLELPETPTDLPASGMDFLARQNPNEIDFTALSAEQFAELHQIAQRGNNTALLDALEQEASRRLAQEHRNQQRQAQQETTTQQGELPLGVAPDSLFANALNVEGVRELIEQNPRDIDFASLTDEQLEALEIYALGSTEAVYDVLEDLVEQEIQRRQRRSERPDVLQGDTERSRSGFDTAEGRDAAQRGTTTENRFDNTTEFPTPDSIMEALDGIMRELEALTPSQTQQKMRLEQQMAEAQAALQRRIPARGGRGTRLNMGIDPMQLGAAARGLWNNIRDAIHKRLMRTERLEYPGSEQILDRKNWDTDEMLNVMQNEVDDDIFDAGRASELPANRGFQAGFREGGRRSAERRLLRSINTGETDSTRMVSGGVDSELDALADSARARDRGVQPSGLEEDSARYSSLRTDYGFSNTDNFPTSDSIVDRMREIQSEVNALTENDVQAVTRLLDELQQAQDELEWRAEQAGVGEGPKLRTGVNPTQLIQAAQDLWRAIIDYIRTKLPRVYERISTFISDEEGFIRWNRGEPPDPEELRGAAQRDVERLQEYGQTRDLAEDVSDAAMGIKERLGRSSFETGKVFGQRVAEGESLGSALLDALGTFGASLKQPIREAFTGTRLYNRAAAKGDTTEKALRRIYRQVGLKADDATIKEHIKNLDSLVGEGGQANIVTDILEEVQSMTLQDITRPEVKNLLTTKLRGADRKSNARGDMVLNYNKTFDFIRAVLDDLEVDAGTGYPRISENDPPMKKIRQRLDSLILKGKKLDEQLDLETLDALMEDEDFSLHPFIQSIVKDNKATGKLIDKHGFTESDRRELALIFSNVRDGGSFRTMIGAAGDTKKAENFYMTMQQNPYLREIIDLENRRVKIHDLVDLWDGIYNRFFRPASKSSGWDHPDMIQLLHTIQEDIHDWAFERNSQGKYHQNRSTIRQWLKELEARQEKVSMAFRDSVIESFKNMRPNQFFDTFTSMDTNTIQAVLEMLGGRTDDKARISIDEIRAAADETGDTETSMGQAMTEALGSPKDTDVWTDAELRAMLEEKGKGKKGKGKAREYTPVEKLDILRTVLVDQLLEKTYARQNTKPTYDNPTQAKDAAQVYIHTLDELLDAIDLRDGQSTGRGELIFGAEVWQNLRAMKPTKALFQWLSSASSRGRGGVIKRMFGGLLVEMLPYLRSTEHGKEFYRTLTAAGEPADEFPWSEFMSMLFSKSARAAPRARATARGVSRGRNEAQRQERLLPFPAAPSTQQIMNAR